MSDEVAEMLGPGEVKEVKEVSVVVIDKLGALEFSNQMQLGNAARLAIKMKLPPKHLMDDGLEAVMSALVACKQYSLPLSAMNEMAYVKGKLTFFGSLVTALVERHPEYGEKEEFFITKEGDRICFDNKNLFSGVVWAHVMRIKKRNAETWNEYFFSIDDAEKAKLLTKSTSPDSGWVKYTKDLLMHKNKSRAYKANYASALNGINYHEDIAYEAAQPSLAKEMNDKFLGDEVERSV